MAKESLWPKTVGAIDAQANVEHPIESSTVMQYLDTERESPSRFFERIRERILEQEENEKNPSDFLIV